MKGENDMKRFVLIQALLCISLFAMAQKCKVLSQEVGSIKFEVDKDLPAPKQRITMLESDKVATCLHQSRELRCWKVIR